MAQMLEQAPANEFALTLRPLVTVPAARSNHDCPAPLARASEFRNPI